MKSALRTAVLVALCLCFVSTSRPALANRSNPWQDRSSRIPRTENFDIEHLRLQITLHPDERIARGQLHIQVRYADLSQSSARRLVLPTSGIRLTRASLVVPGNHVPVSLGIVDSTDFAVLVIPSDSSLVEAVMSQGVQTDNFDEHDKRLRNNVFTFLIEFDIQAGLIPYPLGQDSGAWKAVRTDPLGARTPLLPFPINIDDSFSAELRISAPPDWTVLIAGKPGPVRANSSQQTRIAYFESTTSPAQLGFTAFSGTDPQIRQVTVQTDSAYVALLKRSRGFFDRFTEEKIADQKQPEDPGESRFFTWIYQNQVQALGSGLYLIPDPAQLDPPYSHSLEFLTANVGATEWVMENLKIAAQDHAWMVRAIASYLVADYILEMLGSGVYTSHMWDFRDRYFDSIKTSQSVVQQGNSLSNAEVADARMLWVLRMLSDRVGRKNFQIALQGLAGRSRLDIVGIDDLQRELEEASGESLAGFFRSWVSGSGHPIVDYEYDVRASQDAIDVIVTQKQKTPGAETVFEMDVQMQVMSLSGVDSAYVRLRSSREYITIPISLRPQLVLFDPEGRALYEPESPLSTEQLISGLRRAGNEAIQIALLRRLKDRRIEAAHLLGLRPILSNTLSDTFSDRFSNRFADIVRAHLVDLLGQAAPSSSAHRELIRVSESDNPIVLAAALRGLSHFEGSSEGRSRALLAANSSRNPLVLAAAVESLARLDSNLTLAVLQSAMVTQSQNDFVRRRAIGTLMQSSVAEPKKWDMILPLLTENRYLATRVEAWSAASSQVDLRQYRMALLHLWPQASLIERRILMNSLENRVRAGELAAEEKDILQLWRSAEPDQSMKRRLRAFTSKFDERQ